MSVTTEKTVEREADVGESTGVTVDGEDEVVNHLQDVSSAADRWDAAFEAEDVGRIVGAEIRRKTADDSALLHREAFGAAHGAVREVGTTVGADGDWTVPSRSLVVEVELPNGDAFEESFDLPHAGDDARIFDLCDALGVVPEAGESLADEAVPVERDDGEWRVTVPNTSADVTEEAASEVDAAGTDAPRESEPHREAVSPLTPLAGLALIVAGVVINNGFPVFFGVAALAIGLIDCLVMAMDDE